MGQKNVNMHVYYATIDALTPEAYQYYLHRLPEAEHSKVLKYRRPQDAYLSVLGKALLMRGLADSGYDDTLRDAYKVTEFGRPYMLNGPKFNIAHSGNVAVCAISETTVGVDIENVTRIDIDVFEDHFVPEEWNLIQKATNPTVAFYTLWCKKEAVIKADGKGLSNALNDVITLTDQTELNDIIYHTRLHFIYPDYIMATASTCGHEMIKLIQVDTI
jgi:4'-phosphopantetheinyl transferase